MLARAEDDEAPFAGSDELKAWVAEGLSELRLQARPTPP